MSHHSTLSRVAALGLLACGLISGAAQAALVDRGGGLIYDTDLDVTWLQDANYAQTSGYNANGLMPWFEATIWAGNLSYFDAVRNVTYDDWRLPTTTDIHYGNSGYGWWGCDWAYSGTDCGYNVDPASSEMAHLFFTELGNLSVFAPSGATRDGSSGVNWGLVNSGPFINFQFYGYWSGASMWDPSSAWYFDTIHGYQDEFHANFGMYTLAVRPGDVAAVPEAETYALMLAGLGLVGWRVQRRR